MMAYGDALIYSDLVARALALAISFARLLGDASVTSELRSCLQTAVTPSTAARKAASLAFDDLLKPVTFLTNCREAARISSSVTGGSKLKSVLMFLHMGFTSIYPKDFSDGLHMSLNYILMQH
jgi:hypothetical protein